MYRDGYNHKEILWEVLVTLAAESSEIFCSMINLKGIRIFQHDLVRIQRGIECDIHILVRGFIRINGTC